MLIGLPCKRDIMEKIWVHALIQFSKLHLQLRWFTSQRLGAVGNAAPRINRQSKVDLMRIEMWTGYRTDSKCQTIKSSHQNSTFQLSKGLQNDTELRQLQCNRL